MSSANHSLSTPILRFVLVFCGVFILLSAASYFLLSDGWGIQRVYDTIIRVGWPYLMFERGGFAYRNEIYWDHVAYNALIVGCFAAVVAFSWSLIQDSRE